MTDKEKFREEVERLKSQLIRGACASQIAMETRCKEEAYNEVLVILDSLQEEPVSKDYRERYKRIAQSDVFRSVYTNKSLGEVMPVEGKEPDYCCGECAKWIDGKGCSREKQNTHCITDAACEEGVKRGSKQKKPKFKVHDYIKPIDSSLGSPRTICEVCDGWYVTNQGTLDFEYEDNWELVREPVSEELEKIVEEIAEPTILNAYGAKELARRLRNTICGTSVSGDLGEYINELSKQFPEVSFAKLSRIAVRVAKWQAEQFEKERLKHCDELTEEQAQMESDFVIQHLKKNNRTPTFIDAIEYGMKMQKQQMMAKAIDGDITFDYYGDDDKTYGCIAHDSFCLEDFGLKDRDKVKMILIKE